MVVMITPVAFESIGYQTYIIFAVINAFMVPSVYFFYPETAYRSLEEMDTIFHKVEGASGYLSVVKVAREEPRRYGKNGELLIPYEETDEHFYIIEYLNYLGEILEILQGCIANTFSRRTSCVS